MGKWLEGDWRPLSSNKWVISVNDRPLRAIVVGSLASINIALGSDDNDGYIAVNLLNERDRVAIADIVDRGRFSSTDAWPATSDPANGPLAMGIHGFPTKVGKLASCLHFDRLKPD